MLATLLLEEAAAFMGDPPPPVRLTLGLFKAEPDTRILAHKDMLSGEIGKKGREAGEGSKRR